MRRAGARRPRLHGGRLRGNAGAAGRPASACVRRAILCRLGPDRRCRSVARSPRAAHTRGVVRCRLSALCPLPESRHARARPHRRSTRRDRMAEHRSPAIRRSAAGGRHTLPMVEAPIRHPISHGRGRNAEVDSRRKPSARRGARRALGGTRHERLAPRHKGHTHRRRIPAFDRPRLGPRGAVQPGHRSKRPLFRSEPAERSHDHSERNRLRRCRTGPGEQATPRNRPPGPDQVQPRSPQTGMVPSSGQARGTRTRSGGGRCLHPARHARHYDRGRSPS